jgi:hypothetical protein
MFAWSRIYNENDRLQEVNEDIAKAENTIIENFFGHIAERLFEEAGNIQKSIENQKPMPVGLNLTAPEQELVPTSSNIGFKPSSNTVEPSAKEQEQQSAILGKLRTNDMLRYILKQKYEGKIDWPESRIKRECAVKKWKVYEFKNMMITAGIISEPYKYKQNGL